MPPKPPSPSFHENVLFAVTGMSPAILTETVWALAHETPSFVPNRVVVLTTRRGASQIREALLTPFAPGAPCVWDDLRAALIKKKKASSRSLRFGDTADDIRLFSVWDETLGRHVELDDIRGPADNAAVADFMLEKLRAFTENPDVRLVASIAGGRKTMGALLYACMSLIGRETDRLTHVLVNEPFDDPRLTPRFYFPAQREKTLRAPDGRAVPVSRAAIELADLPFVPLRNRFMELGNMPGGFGTLVRHYARELRTDGECVVTLDGASVAVNGKPLKLTHRGSIILRFAMDLNQRDAVPHGINVTEKTLRDFIRPLDAAWADNALSGEIRKHLSEIRRACAAVGVSWGPGKNKDALRLPPFRVEETSRKKKP